MSIYETLAAIAAEKAPAGYLAGYANDLHVHDKNTLAAAAPGSRWLWILREHGTELFEVASGRHPVWATHWLTQGNSRTVPTLVYLVTVGPDKAKWISYERATRLTNEPHPQGRKVRLSLTGDRLTAA